MADTTEAPDTATASSAQTPGTLTPVSDKGPLASLIAQATAKYAIKDYLPAAEYYSQATELQAELNGEMAAENADLLYSYGKCLYFVAVKNSDVLGGEAAGAKLGPQNPAQEKKQKKVIDAHAAMTKADEVQAPDAAQPFTAHLTSLR